MRSAGDSRSVRVVRARRAAAGAARSALGTLAALLLIALAAPPLSSMPRQDAGGVRISVGTHRLDSRLPARLWEFGAGWTFRAAVPSPPGWLSLGWTTATGRSGEELSLPAGTEVGVRFLEAGLAREFPVGAWRAGVTGLVGVTEFAYPDSLPNSVERDLVLGGMVTLRRDLHGGFSVALDATARRVFTARPWTPLSLALRIERELTLPGRWHPTRSGPSEPSASSVRRDPAVGVGGRTRYDGGLVGAVVPPPFSSSVDWLGYRAATFPGAPPGLEGGRRPGERIALAGSGLSGSLDPWMPPYWAGSELPDGAGSGGWLSVGIVNGAGEPGLDSYSGTDATNVDGPLVSYGVGGALGDGRGWAELSFHGLHRWAGRENRLQERNPALQGIEGVTAGWGTRIAGVRAGFDRGRFDAVLRGWHTDGERILAPVGFVPELATEFRTGGVLLESTIDLGGGWSSEVKAGWQAASDAPDPRRREERRFDIGEAGLDADLFVGRSIGARGLGLRIGGQRRWISSGEGESVVAGPVVGVEWSGSDAETVRRVEVGYSPLEGRGATLRLRPVEGLPVETETRYSNGDLPGMLRMWRAARDLPELRRLFAAPSPDELERLRTGERLRISAMLTERREGWIARLTLGAEYRWDGRLPSVTVAAPDVVPTSAYSGPLPFRGWVGFGGLEVDVGEAGGVELRHRIVGGTTVFSEWWSRRPRTEARAWHRLGLTSDVDLVVDATAQGEVVWYRSRTGVAEDDVRIPPRAVVDAKLETRLWRGGLTAAIGVRNLTGADRRLHPLGADEGRSLVVELRTILD